MTFDLLCGLYALTPSTPSTSKPASAFKPLAGVRHRECVPTARQVHTTANQKEAFGRHFRADAERALPGAAPRYMFKKTRASL